MVADYCKECNQPTYRDNGLCDRCNRLKELSDKEVGDSYAIEYFKGQIKKLHEAIETVIWDSENVDQGPVCDEAIVIWKSTLAKCKKALERE